MEIQNLKEDIKVFYVKAASFPGGIRAAHQKLHSILQEVNGRRFFGISYLDRNGNIVYKAAVEESYSGEAEKYGCGTFVIKKGEYLSETLIDWCKDETTVARTFQKLLSDPRIDRNGYCLEVYLSKTDMTCMVGINTAGERV